MDTGSHQNMLRPAALVIIDLLSHQGVPDAAVFRLVRDTLRDGLVVSFDAPRERATKTL